MSPDSWLRTVADLQMLQQESFAAHAEGKCVSMSCDKAKYSLSSTLLV